MMTESLPSHALADDAVLSGVARALGDLRRGALVLLQHGEALLLMQAAEGVRDAGLEALRRLGGSPPALLLTARRAAALGLAVPPQDDFLALDLLDRPAERIVELADPTVPLGRPLARLSQTALPHRLAQAAIDLVKLARLVPAAVVAVVAPARRAAVLADGEILSVTAEAVAEYRFAGARSLVEVAAARVPLAGAEDATIRAFRPGDGGLENLAIVIGRPDPAQDAVLVRLHSECFTGDLLGSLRCDCGDQLRGAIEAIAAEGAGVLLYLAQEGRGIGLVNKLRAYALQDRGADTLDANLQLGFDADERVYLPAAEMLRRLGIRRVRLLTNNPQKVAALERCGVSVVERVPHAFPDNRHNRPYLETKARRFGHLF